MHLSHGHTIPSGYLKIIKKVRQICHIGRASAQLNSTNVTDKHSSTTQPFPTGLWTLITGRHSQSEKQAHRPLTKRWKMPHFCGSHFCGLLPFVCSNNGTISFLLCVWIDDDICCRAVVFILYTNKTQTKHRTEFRASYIPWPFPLFTLCLSSSSSICSTTPLLFVFLFFLVFFPFFLSHVSACLLLDISEEASKECSLSFGSCCCSPL